MTLDQWIHRVNRQASPLMLLLVGALLIGGLEVIRRGLESRIALQQRLLQSLEQQGQRLEPTVESLGALEHLKAQDVLRLKEALQSSAESHKSLFEEGLTLQEEKRLLEKTAGDYGDVFPARPGH